MQTDNVEQTSQNQLLGVPEAARYLAISERTVRALIQSGQLNVVRIGRRVAIRLAELETFIKAHQA
ncbi:MAG: helix-turn-helix domain-containing protein [Terriglobales bacterium]